MECRSPRDRQSGPKPAAPTEHNSESDQHLAMKRALKDRVGMPPGWDAEVECAHPERAWIADVMAILTSGKSRSLLIGSTSNVWVSRALVLTQNRTI